MYDKSCYFSILTVRYDRINYSRSQIEIEYDVKIARIAAVDNFF